jgi:hypothetical protein
MNTESPDPHRSLSPLDPAVAEHLTKTLGAPESFLLAQDGGRDIRALGWVIGKGSIEAASNGPTRRGTIVTIWLTEGGQLVTHRESWKKGEPYKGRVFDGAEGTGRVNSSPATALQWLVDDGKGRLGPASKAAWVQACRSVPSMNTFEYEHVD